MRALFITGGNIGAVFHQAPLARAARDAGHDVVMAGSDKVVPVIAASGIPPVSVSPKAVQDFDDDVPESPEDQMRFVGRWYARTTGETQDALRALAADWRPDVVVGGGLHYPAGLLGHHIGVPAVQQPWGLQDTRYYDEGAAAALRPLLDRMGLDHMPSPDLSIDITPPSLRPASAPPAQMQRWIPGNLHRRLEPWMYTRPERPRVLLTSGSRASVDGALHTMTMRRLQELAEGFADLDVDLVLAVPDDVAEAWGEPREGLRVGWTPFDVVLPTCDLAIHHGGTGTNMTAMALGVPQLVVRELPSSGEIDPQVRFGTLIDLSPEEQSLDNILASSAKILDDRSFAERADVLRREIAEMPPPHEVVGELERLATG